MESRYFLLVDDDSSVLDNGRLSLEEANLNPMRPFDLELITAQTSNEAIELIRQRNIDCAAVDLRLPSNVGDRDNADSGNDLLINMLKELAIPLVIHSGHSGERQFDETEYKVEVIDKEGGSFDRIFTWLYSQAPIINAMSDIRKELWRETALLYQKNILPVWKENENFNEGNGDLKKIMIRQIVSHLAEQFSLPIEGSPKHHINEVYFRPPLRTDRLHTGDLIQRGDDIFIIVTPQCNIANGYPEQFLVAQCKKIGADEISEIKSLLNGSAKNIRSANKSLTAWANQQLPISEHFLPPCGNYGPWKVNFKFVVSIPSNESEILIEGRIASMSSQFIPNLIQRFSTYIGRHGQPDLNVSVLEEFVKGYDAAKT